MNFQELKDRLVISQAKVQISPTSLTAKIGDLLSACYAGQPVTITEAAPEAGADAGETVRIAGRSTFLNVADLPVSARFRVDAGGEVHALFRYRLRDAAPPPGAWTFSRSFPSLPKVFDYDTIPANMPAGRFDLDANQRAFLDGLDLFDTYFVVSSHAEPDPESGVPLEVGINFVSKMRPQGMVGVLEHCLDPNPILTLYGTIHVPLATERVVPLQPLERAWNRPTAPGIHLRAALDMDWKLGGMTFRRAQFRVYSPISTDWLAANPTFRPVHGYSGSLAIPSANIEIDLSADLQWNLAEAFLAGDCSGVTLGKLTQLVDLTGESSLSSYLPVELQKAVDELDKLALMRVAFDVAVPGLVPTVSGVYVTVGFPGVKWKVWGDHLVVEQLGCRFAVEFPSQSPSARAATGGTASIAPAAALARGISVTLFGTLDVEGVPLSIEAGYERGAWAVRAATRDKIDLPLDKLLKSHAENVPQPTPLAISYLALNVALGRSYSMSAVVAGAPNPWIIPIGRHYLTVSDMMFTLTRPASGQATGSFAGSIAFDDEITLYASYDVPGDFIVRSVFRRVNLTKMIERLCDHKLPLPGFDLVLENASVLIQKHNQDYVLLVSTIVKDFGTFSFEVRKVPSGWGFVAGMDLSGGRMSQLPGLSALRAIEDAFRLQKLLLMVATFDDPSFQFPDLAQFNRPQLATKKLALPAQASGAIAGLMFFAEWTIDSGDKKQNLLKTLLGLGGTTQVVVQVGAVPSKSTTLYATRRVKLQGHDFDCRFGVQLTDGAPALFLSGSLTVPVQKSPVTFDVTGLFVPSGAFMSATMKNPKPIDLGPFKLANVAVEIGVNWGGIPSLGLCATIDVKNFSSSVAVFFDSTDPARSLVAGSISNVTAKDVLGAFIPGASTPLDKVLETIAIRGTREFSIPGDLADELNDLDCAKVSAAFAAAKVTIPSSPQQLSISTKKKGASWHLTDLTNMRHYQAEKKGDRIQVQVAPQFYFAPQATSIGTIRFPQAFYLNAAISFAGFDASATIDISPNKGISVEAQMDKIVIADEKLFSIAALKGIGGPRISISTFSQPDNPVAVFRPPHFYINGALTMLGLQQGIYASVSIQGIDFELVGDLIPGVSFDVDARFGKAGIGASGKLKVGVGTVDLGALGKAKINTQLEVDLDLDIDLDNTGPKDASLGLGRSFRQDETLLDNGLANLVFQGDGNLVLYKKGGAPLWASGTNGKGGTRVDLQGDGNLVIYDGAGKPVWATGTNGKGVATLVLQTDGNLVMYDGGRNPKWASNTNGKVDQVTSGISLAADFDFAGQHIDLGRFHLDVSADAFTRIPKVIEKKVENALGELFKDMTKWANAVGSGVMEGVQDTEKVFRDVYGKSEKEAKALANSVSKGATSAAKSIEKGATSAAKSVEKGTKKVIKKVKFW